MTKIFPNVEFKPFYSVQVGSLFLKKMNGMNRYCLRTKDIESDGDPASVVLGPFSDIDFGVPWLDCTGLDSRVLDFGVDWTCQLETESQHFEFPDTENLINTGAVIFTSKHQFLQVVTSDGECIKNYNFETGLTVAFRGERSAVAAMKWNIVLPSANGDDPIFILGVGASKPREHH